MLAFSYVPLVLLMPLPVGEKTPSTAATAHFDRPTQSESQERPARTRREADGDGLSGFTREEIRTAYLRVAQRSAKRADPDPHKVVPQVVAVYVALDRVDGFSHAEKSHKQAVLTARLRRLHGELHRRTTRLEKQIRRNTRHGRRTRFQMASKPIRTARDTRESHAAGKAELARAEKLIELIETTIAPATWDTNGGNGRVTYFPLLHALVVRQTGEVHHQLDGGLQRLRR